MAIYINGVKVAGRGASGKSPYQIAVEGGYTGTEADFNAQLVNIGEATKGFDELKTQVENTIDEINETTALAQAIINDTVSNAEDIIDTKIEDALAQIPDSENLVTKTYLSENYYDKTAINTEIENYYNKSEIDTKISSATSSKLSQVWYYGNSAPSNTKLLWIDSTETTGGLKYYNGSSWMHVPTAWN